MPGVRIMPYMMSCRRDNDLYGIMIANGSAVSRYDTPLEAIDEAPEGGGVLIMADRYPREPTEVDAAVLEKANGKDLRLYVEFPAYLGDRTFGPIETMNRERAVVSSTFFGDELPALRILALHDGHFTPIARPISSNVHIVSALVAGYDTAIFGLPDETCPLLFQVESDLMVSTTKLSQFITARYAPQQAWQAIWRRILAWVSHGEVAPTLSWTPLVRTMYGPDSVPPADFEKRAFDRAIKWHFKSRLLVHASCEKQYSIPIHNLSVCGGKNDPRQHSMPPAKLPNGDGAHGINEGYSSYIAWDGHQRLWGIRRSDVQSETAMAMAVAWKINARERDRSVASNLMDYIYFLSNLQQGPMADPKHPAFGLTAWMDPHPGKAPDNWEYLASDCQQIPSSLAATALLGSDRWDESLLKYLLAVERVTGKQGFGKRMTTRDLEKFGWRYYAELEFPPEDWSIGFTGGNFLLAYQVTGYEPFRRKGKHNICNTMAHYPEELKWWSTLTSARAGLIRDLAWLVRLDNIPQYRVWLHRVLQDQLVTQASCGAFRDDLGGLGYGTVTGNGPCQSNAEYGTRECTLIQQNGDPMADMLYTNGFMLASLHEAYVATGEGYIKEAEDRLAEFICRVQIHSESCPYLDGAWFRGFDFKNWEHWGSTVDVGWGGWSVEAGWNQAWIVAALGLRQLNASLWDLCAQSQIRQKLPEILAMMAQNNGSPMAEAD